MGEFYKHQKQDGSEHFLLVLVEKQTDNINIEEQYKPTVVPSIKRILSDNEIAIILDTRLAQLSNNLRQLLNIWSDEFERDTYWTSIVEQNYAGSTNPSISYKGTHFSPREATKLFVLLSKMKNHIYTIPLKDHLNFIQKLGQEYTNNLFKSCKVAKHYFNLNKLSPNASAQLVLADWSSPTISYITTCYQNGLKALSQDLYLIDKETWPNFLEEIARAFVPQTKGRSDFSPERTLKIKDLLNDLEDTLKKLDVHIQTSSCISEKELWTNYRREIVNIKEYILDAISLFKNLPQKDKDNFEKLFKALPKHNYALIHWFGIVYAYLLKSNSLLNTGYPEGNNEWVNTLTNTLLYIGIMDAILDTSARNTKAVLYVNQHTYETIERNLLKLGYAKTLSITNDPITPDELVLLVNQFPVNTMSLKQLLQRPIASSLTI